MTQPTQNSQPDSPWKYKPWWCQPWSIVLTGTGAIALSWVFFQKIWLTALVGLPLTVWMGYFTLVLPQLMRQSGLLEQLKQQHAQD
uniref:DUF6737 family protein n=1 Tax=Desertifilum tharense IPPAS B-1220 TaxID=1781255 RepID=A0ACD5H277_9CYAN